MIIIYCTSNGNKLGNISASFVPDQAFELCIYIGLKGEGLLIMDA